jgi:exosome complex RNA-binding protein Csl4
MQFSSSSGDKPLYAVPGMEICEQGNFSIGSGCYSSHSKIYASLLGRVVFHQVDTSSLQVCVVPVARTTTSTLRRSAPPTVGDVVIGKVFKVTWRAVVVDIFGTEMELFRYPFRGIIRLADVTNLKTDLHHCFRTGDIVRAQVVSLGDPQAYYLSTNDSRFGVIYATSNAGYPMEPCNENEMICTKTAIKESRKVAK